MDNFYAKYTANTPSTVVTSLNSETGAINLIGGTGITVTPAGQTITIASTGGGTGNFMAEMRTISSGEATAKQITLTTTPSSPGQVVVEYIGVGPQFNGSDYTVSGTTLSWTSQGMDTIGVSAGDKIIVEYAS